jgi:hypothetical protein
LGSNSFSVLSTDVITYNLNSTTPDFCNVAIYDSTHGNISNCNYNSAFIGSGDLSYTFNATIEAITNNFVDGCA